MSNKLFDNSDGSDNDLELKTNENYAKFYKKTRKRELLQKYKEHGFEYSESEDDDSDTDSSDADEEVKDPEFDKEFFNTLASLKSKDPTIYDKKTRFFQQSDANDEGEEKKQPKKSKTITLKDYERKVILENNGNFMQEDNSDEEQQHYRDASPTFIEEEQKLKEEFKNLLQSDEEEEEEAFGGIFKKREKTKEQHESEEADYLQWFAGKSQAIQPDQQQKLEPLKKYWNKNNLSNGEQFLRDYILNKGYAGTNPSSIPTYEEIVGEEKAALTEDEEELDKQEEFEHKYNFRFEEPDTEFIKRYPRTVENSVRRSDDKRRQKRLEVKERKEAEKAQKMRELEMVKELKRKEIEEKLLKLKMVTGNEELAFKDEELDEDFDPEAHDRRMQELFNDNYYAVDEGEEKPECPSDIEELKVEDWDAYDPNADNVAEDPHCEDDDFNMDCEYDATTAKDQLQQELIENTRGRKGRKARRRDKFMEMIRAEKPRFNPDAEKTYAEYIDEYYKLDCEDFVADLPCRFKYVETIPNDFGLTIEEILLAKNKELNKWASLKKAIQIRPEKQEKQDARLYKLKAKNEDLKRKIFKSLYGEASDNDDDDDDDDAAPAAAAGADNNATIAPNTQLAEESAEVVACTSAVQNNKKKKKKKKKKHTSQSNADNAGPAAKKPKMESNMAKGTNKSGNSSKVNKKATRAGNPFGGNGGQKPVKKFRARPNAQQNDGALKIDDNRIRAYGINPKKLRKRQKYGKK